MVPDFDFSEYRKYTPILNREIYVHSRASSARKSEQEQSYTILSTGYQRMLVIQVVNRDLRTYTQGDQQWEYVGIDLQLV